MIHNWEYNDKTVNCIEELPKEVYGFIYKITHIESGKDYIGKKQLIQVRKKRLTKKEIALHQKPGRKPKSKTVKTESNWLNYYGSSSELLADIEKHGKEAFKREIIHVCYSKKQLTYWEIYYQMITQVLLRDSSYNSNIQGKFFREDLK